MSGQPACPAGIDDSFGPWAGHECRGGFDFTLLFEESIITIPLQCLFLLALPVRYLQLAKANTKVVSSPLVVLKLCAAVCLLALNVAQLTTWATTSSHVQTRATMPTAALVFIASLGLCPLSWLEHERTIRPSFLLSVYLFLSILLDVVRARTLWMLDPHAVTPALLTASLAVRAVMFVLESTEKRGILISPYKDYSVEMTSSSVSRSVFFWLTSLFLSGYEKVLAMEDLYPLDTRMHSAPLHQALVTKWAQVSNKAAPGALVKTWLRAFAGPIMEGVIPKLCQIGFTYAQPFLVNAAIDLAVEPRTPAYDNVGYGLIGAYIIVYTGIAISTGQYEWRMHRTASLMRGSVVATIYGKSLRLDLTSSGTSPEGALTFINTDVEIITPGIVYLHDIWGSLVEIAIGIYLIYRELGAACAMPIAIVFVSMVVVTCLAVPTGTAQAAWVQASQDRVTATTRALGSVKWLKISGLSELAFSKIRDLRTQELKTSIRYRRLQGVCMVLLICVPIWSPILTLCTYAGIAASGGGTLTIAQAFTSFALFTLVSKPLADIIQSLPIIATSMASFQRIQDFLNGKEWVDNRLVAAPGSKLDTESGRSDSSLGQRSNHLEFEANPGLGAAHEKGIHALALEDDIIASVQGTFSWAEESEPAIDIIDWRIRKHAFTLVLGPVGCGKSTLLKSLLGELSAFKGTINTSFSRVGYCAQNAWLPNDTVRNVIIGRSPFETSWYDAVLKACALEQDIRTWPDGENTATGRKGFSLSGGQKHRVSLARALYSRPDLLIFDDVFSGLDSATEDLVFNSLLGREGLIRNGNMTVVMTSSDARRGPYADYVVFLNDKGQISEKGTVEELSEKVNRPQTEAVVGPRPLLAPKEETLETQRVDTQPVVPAVAIEDLPEDATRWLGDSAIYKFYANAVGWFSLTTFCIAMTVFAFCSTFPNIWIKWWAEANETNPNENLGKWIGGYIGFGTGSAAAVLFGTYQLFIIIVNHSGVYFHDLLLKTTSKAPMSFHGTVDSGVTVNRFSQDLQLIDMELPITALGLAVGVTFCVADFIMISVSSKYIAAFLPFVIATLYVMQHFYLRTSRQLRLLDIEHKAPLYTQLTQTIDGLQTIRAFKWESSFEEKNTRLLDDSQRPSYLLFCVQRWLTFVVDILIALIAVLLAILTTTLREQIGPGFIGIALSNILAFSATIKTILMSWVMLEVSLGAVARVRKFASETKPEDFADGPLAEPEGGKWPSQGAVALHEVTASYSSSEPVLTNISFSIQPREKVVICGRTGSGKSSLLLCLLRLVQLDSGTITIDGVQLSTLPHEYVRSKLVAVPQETYIFDDTVRHNLDPGQAASDEDIVSALQKVQLWDKIKQRGGLDTVIQDEFLSQGEAQLFVFARAMLRKSKVLLLDEFESSLDEETSNVINEVLRSAFQDWTVIAIAHKLHKSLDFDKAIVLDGGKVVECDEPRRLLERDSMFKKLYELSTRS
ncbi:hypothetical protein DL769_001296 [Monosporascus sp. CRB-8-3]|nr:hypothetical protein DL769_001296 [Monosporascus sp. CRB-8-3]